MLAYAAIIPHPPFAIESVGKDKVKQFNETVMAIKRIGEDIMSLNVDSLLIITPFGERYDTSLALALHDPYVASLKEFGDMSTSISIKPDLRFIDRLQRTIRKAGLLSTMTTNEELDYGASVPLIMLQNYLDNVKLTVVTPPVDSPKALVELGNVMREAINNSEHKIAVLCSAELSNRLSELSHGGIHPDAEKFDKRIRIALADGNSVQLLKITEKEVNDQGAQGLDAIRLFWGILGDTDHTMEEVSYEHPLGVGHLVMIAKLR